MGPRENKPFFSSSIIYGIGNPTKHLSWLRGMLKIERDKLLKHNFCNLKEEKTKTLGLRKKNGKKFACGCFFVESCCSLS